MDKQALLDCWTMFRREHNNISVDRVACDPKLRNEFVEVARRICGCEDEEQILWTLMGLRKRKLLSNS